jgi:WD40 repeat protein
MSEPEPKFVAQPGAADPIATRLVAELQHDRGILTCRYDPTSQFLFAGARDYFVHRWDLAQEAVIDPPADPKKKSKVPPIPQAPADSRIQMAGHESWVGGISLFADGERLATGDFVGRVGVWSDRTVEPKLQFSFAAHKGSIRKVAVSPEGHLIATAGNDGAVRVWHAETAQKLHLELLGHDSHVYHVAFHPDGKHLVSADLKGRVKHWSVETGKLVRELDASLLYTYSEKYEVDVGGIRGMSFNADGSQLCCSGATGEKGIAHSGNARVLLFDWESGELLKVLRPEKEEICTAWGVQFHPDGFIVGSGGSRTGGFLWFWTPNDEVAFHVVKFKQRAPGFDVDLAPNKKHLAVANHDGAVRLYEMAAAKEVQQPDKKA